MNAKSLTHVVIGGGAAGFFGAIACAQHHPHDRVIIVEKTRQILAKVRISGGGRCNVTHACFDPAQLIRYYPRGSRELRGPFTRFQPKDTMEWFESRGVKLKIEEDGRVFPVTDQSETIIHCLTAEAKRLGVEIWLEKGIQQIEKIAGGFELTFNETEKLRCNRLLIATGSNPKMYTLLEQLGHHIVPLVPSLFTFNVPDSPLLDLAGVSVPHVKVKINETSLEQEGPLLITHWGFSGPAILRLSAWGARTLHEMQYHATLCINWLPQYTEDVLKQALNQVKQQQSTRLVGSESPFELPKQLWKKLISLAHFSDDQRWANLSKKQMSDLLVVLRASSFAIQGKTTYKQEFVTSGGVALEDINFKTMESRQCPGLYFAGEVLDIDGITGGFNFQNAWTTSWIAGQSMNLLPN